MGEIWQYDAVPDGDGIRLIWSKIKQEEITDLNADLRGLAERLRKTREKHNVEIPVEVEPKIGQLGNRKIIV